MPRIGKRRTEEQKQRLFDKMITRIGEGVRVGEACQSLGISPSYWKDLKNKYNRIVARKQVGSTKEKSNQRTAPGAIC